MAIPRVIWRVLLGSAVQGLAVYDHMRALAVHGHPLNAGLPVEEHGSGRLIEVTATGPAIRRSFRVTAGGVEDAEPETIAGGLPLIVSGSMAFPDQEHAENALAHAHALALQGAAVLTAGTIEAMPVWAGERASTGGWHWCAHEQTGPCPPPVERLRVEPAGAGTTEWAPGQVVVAGDLRSYGGITYRCIQGHTTQLGWEPPAVPALWEVA